MTDNLLTLDFFASIFRLNKEDLSYGFGINEDKSDDVSSKTKEFFFVVILIKNKNLYIDVDKHEIFSIERPNINIRFEECTFTEIPDGYRFESAERRQDKTEDEMQKFYSNRIFCKGTGIYVGWTKKEIKK